MAGFRQWVRHAVERRFVAICEVIGYTVSLLLAAGLIGSVFIRMEIVARADASVRPAIVTVDSERAAAVLERMVPDSARVARGDALLRVTATPEELGRTVARRRLQEAMAALESATDAVGMETRSQVEQALAKLPVSESGDVVVAPTTGIVRFAVEAKEASGEGKAHELARLYDPGIVEATVTLGASPCDARVQAGQEAKVRLSEPDVVLVGRVAAVQDNGGARSASIRMDAVPEEIQKRLVARMSSGLDVSLPAKVEIVVGYQSLFRQTFGRKQ